MYIVKNLTENKLIYATQLSRFYLCCENNVEVLLILLFQTVFFLGGWIFFVKQLFRDYEVHHTLVQLIFSVTFALSCTMFELIIFEIIGYLDSR